MNYELLNLVPKLKPGVIIHLRDIFIPSECPNNWVLDQKIFWSEQYLLQAFLALNRDFEVLWAGSWMHLRHPERIMKAFDSYDSKQSWPASFWMRRLR